MLKKFLPLLTAAAFLQSCSKSINDNHQITEQALSTSTNRSPGGVDLQAGLIAYYPFNSNANDIGRKFDGSVQGATLTTDRFGKKNKAYSFDGINDYIYVPNMNQTYFDNKNFSISLWVSFRNFNSDFPHLLWGENGYLVFYAIGGSNSDYYSDKIGFYMNEANTPYNTANGGVQSYSKVSINDWHNVIIIKDGSQVKLYIDGAFSNSGTYYTTGLSLVAGKGLYFGTAAQSGYTFYLDGKLDDIRIYNRALQVTEVINLSQN